MEYEIKFKGLIYKLTKHNKYSKTECKGLYQAKPDKFLIVWKWEDCMENKHIMYDENKAFRLYNCIDLK